MGDYKIYGIADKAWQIVVGCDPHMSCAPRCWARRTVARIVECQKPQHPDRAEFFQIALTPDGKRWSGEVRLDESHLLDPRKWRKPALIATGFHGDWGRLSHEDKDRMAAVMALCPQHQFMPLTKQPDGIVSWCNRLQGMAAEWSPKTTTGKFSPADVLNFRWMHATFGRGPAFPHHPWPFKNVSIGCSVMNQAEADKMRGPMAVLASRGWRTHVWYEPALGPVDWKGWHFIELLIMGGESGQGARPSDLRWYRSSVRWCRIHDIAVRVKQLGADPRESNANGSCRDINCTHPDCGWIRYETKDRKGADISEFPEDLRVRELPEVLNART